MQQINIINPAIDNIEKLRDVLLRAAFPINSIVSPDVDGVIGKMYNSFASKLYEVIYEMNDILNDWYNISIDNLDNRLLDDLCIAYGLPDLLFNKLETNLEKTLAIIIRRFIIKCKSAENFEEMFRMLGIEVKIECKNTEAGYMLLPAMLPMMLGGFQPQDKNKFIVYVKNEPNDFYNLGGDSTLPLLLAGGKNNIAKVKYILENYLQIVDKIFEYRNL